MGNAFDRMINKGPPFAPRCVPECTPGPYDLRGNICYKGKCVSLCPVNSIATEDGKCLCTEDNAKFTDSNTRMKNKPLEGDGWGYCADAALEKKFKPEYLFIDRVPKELDERVKVIVKKELKKNPTMSDKELQDLISKTTIDVIEELATECKDEYKVVKMVLSPSYGNGKWPTKQELRVLIDTKDFPWLKSQVDKWPEQKDITSCKILSVVKDIISINNGCMYTDEYPDIKEECNVECGLGVEVRKKRIIKKPNIDFPSLQPCQSIPPIKEFECDSGVVCKEDCKIVMNTGSYAAARCSKPCDSGDGPGQITYKVKYVKASQGEPGDKGSCELDERGKEEGKEYEITTDCNKEKCPDCEIESKGPYKDNLVDYTGSIVDGNGNDKTYTKCLLPKEDGTFESMDCGSAVGGHNYDKGARAKYNVSYKITEDAFGVQSCTKGKDVVEEGCPVNAFDTELNPIIGSDGKLLKGGGEECENQCILSDDYSTEEVPCNKTCGGGIKIMRKTVKSKRNAKYCPCKEDTSKCPPKEVPCNTQECIKDCVYTNGKDTKHVQINDPCPGDEGINENVVWDTEKEMWYDDKTGKFYERKHFVKKMRVPTKEPIIGKGKCHQGTKSDFTLDCPTLNRERPIDAVWKDWEHDGTYRGWGETLSEISEEHSTWDVEGNPNFGKKGKHCVKEPSLTDATEEYLPGKNMIRRIQKKSQYGGQIFSTIKQHDEGAIRKTVDYMLKDDGSGYTKYCPEDVTLLPHGAWDTEGFDFKQEKCYQPNNPESRKKYTEEELEKESKKSFVRDNALPEYDTPRGGKKTRIVKPGTRNIYQYKAKDELQEFPAKYGGFTSGKWHKTSKGYTSTQDKRLFEYNECPGVGEVLKKIRENNDSWKSNSMIEQMPCEPVYNWDGKFYKDKASAQAGSTAEEIVTHSDTGKKELSEEEKKKNPGRDARKTNKGKFITNTMHDDCQKPGLDSNTGWCGNKSTHDYIQMTTEFGEIELVKGVVTQGRYGTSDQWVKKFEVYVSRNGDSWKQMKNSSNQTEFTGNTETNKKVTNYFNEVVEARYIRFVPKTWNNYNSMRIGYIRDNSGAVNCTGESGMTKGNPWFRFTFNKEKTKVHGKYSEGTAKTTKICPNEGDVMLAEKTPDGVVYTTQFDVNKIKVFKDNKADFVKAYIPKQIIGGCGVDPTSKGWFSSNTFASSGKWSACVKPINNTGLEGTLPAWNKDDGGFRYMYRHWGPESNNDGYTKVSNSNYKDNTHSSYSNNGSTYNVIPTNFTIRDYGNFNTIRQPCNRGTKGVVPTIGTNWKSTTPYSSGQKTGHMGELWNLEGGVEGWINSGTKYTWANGFNNQIKQLTASGNILHDYKIEEREGTNNNDDTTSWSSGWRGSNSKIGGKHGWHSPQHNHYWNTSVTRDRWTARYKDMARFIPVGIRIQPRNNGSPIWQNYSPTQIKFRFYVRVNNGKVNKGWHWGETVTLGPFGSKDDVKTILIKPEDRIKFKECDHFYIYTRHGRGSGHTGFRINFLVGKPGVSVEDPSSSVSASDPVDCKVEWDGAKRDIAGSWSGWSGWSSCSNSCGGSGTQTRSRTRKMTKVRDRKVVSPKDGGKNNCTATRQDYPNENSTQTDSQNSSCSGHCPGWSCGHCNEHSRCGNFECRVCLFGPHSYNRRWMPGGC